jgi:hypothetical protein
VLVAFSGCARPIDDTPAPRREIIVRSSARTMAATDAGFADSAAEPVDTDAPKVPASSSAAKAPAANNGKSPAAAGKEGVQTPMAPPRAAADSSKSSSQAAATDAAVADGGDASSSDPQPAVQCQPKAERISVLEGDALSIKLSCTLEGVVPSMWSIDNLPAGATLDAAQGTLSWRPSLTQAASYQLTAQAVPFGETTTLDINVVDRWDATGNEPPLDPAKYLEEYGLPVMHLTTDPSLNDDEYTPATIVYQGHTYTGTEAKHRGATSASYPKRSFTLKFTKEDKFNEPARAFLKKRKITLITSFDDNSYLRQRLGYELWNRLDPNGHIRVQSYNVVVYLNGEYHGLYTLADHVDGYLMEDFGYDQEGNLYKARSYDANFRLSSGVAFTPEGMALPKETLHDGFTKEEGTPEDGQPGAFDDLDALVTWAATSSAAEFARTIDSTLARKEYEDWWIWVSFILADDSAGKNSYHYHDPLLAGSVWHFVPWDLNASFGQDWKTFRSPAKGSPPDAWFRSVNNLFDRILSDPNMGPALEARYGEELRGPLAGDTIIALFDGFAREIEESALRDEQKWRNAYREYMLWRSRTDFTSYQQEVAYVRSWIADRHAYLDGIY